MSRLISPSDEIEEILAKSAGALDRVIRRMARAVATQDTAATEAARFEAARLLGRVLSYSDLLGRRRMQLLFGAAGDKAERDERRRVASEPVAIFAATFGAVPEGGVLPRVEFDEAVEDIARRMPRVVNGWRNVAELYATKHAFACARSMEAAVTRKVQQIIADAMRGGIVPDPESAIMAETGWSRGYATTVYRTNSQTAYSAGVWARAAEPDVMAVIPGFEFVSAHLPTSRPNHEACAGLIAPTDSHLWNRYSPPLGYNCMDSLAEVTVFEAERQGLIRDGKMLTVLPPGFGLNARADPGFGTARPDRLALFGSFS